MSRYIDRADVADFTGTQGPTPRVWDGHAFVPPSPTDTWAVSMGWCERCGATADLHAAADPERAARFRSDLVALDLRALAIARRA